MFLTITRSVIDRVRLEHRAYDPASFFLSEVKAALPVTLYTEPQPLDECIERKKKYISA